jgi:hypothetical protein
MDCTSTLGQLCVYPQIVYFHRIRRYLLGIPAR